ncbi:hypothetical protein PVAND_014449 [Polypedilum vanderplanki]|uniref:Peptidase S1 domain-containing protein n=1 Tax=Polypedilum vanderplanki TaxID=319348 RepID=A0A9J6B9F6_POLVA|nr:hypothetical protein PVAND_014449 [Polypedilum vanderplanki]
MLRVVSFLLAFALIYVTAIRSGRIVGGNNVIPGELPFQVSLRFWGSGFHFAGGALLNERWVLTAGNYLVGRENNSISIVVGTTSLTANVVNHRSDRIIVHENFNRDQNLNNIGLVRSAILIQMTVLVQPIPLGTNIISPPTTARVSGWGATDSDKGPDSNFLQSRFVEVINCQNTRYFNALSQHLCAEATICTTDIGGPLTVSNQLIGIAAWHDPLSCGNSASQDFYMRISFFRNWILGIIN